MASKELLQIIKKDYNWETSDCECDTYFKDYFTQIEKDLEVLEIFKKYLLHIKPFFHNQEQWNREEFRFTIESDNIWLEGEDREQYRNNFLKIKEWYLKEIKNENNQ